MRRLVLLVGLGLILSGIAYVPTAAQGSSLHKQSCKTVTKKVHGKKKKVRVCHTVKAKPTATKTATATSTPTATATATPTATNTPVPKFTLHGTLEAPGCYPYNITYANVVVRDESDQIIGTTETSGDTNAGDLSKPCSVSFTLPNLPKVQYYQIHVGSHGGPTYSFNELVQDNWTIRLVLT